MTPTPLSRAVARTDYRLTPHQREILQLFADGLRRKEIAERLVIAEATVKVHFAQISNRLGARDTPDCVVIGLREGWLR